MRYWWVNQNQTFRQETAGGYLWSPKRNANGAKNPFYETMREVSPGDIVFSFVDTLIAAIGVAQSYCWESPKPAEFGATGQYWEDVGWKVRVQFTPIVRRVRPKDHIEILRPLAPARYGPLQANGDGKQGVYLTLSIAGHVSRAMLSRYSHLRMEAKRRALDEIAAPQRAADEKRKAQSAREKCEPAIRSRSNFGSPASGRAAEDATLARFPRSSASRPSARSSRRTM
jgi:hypothetical protein